MRIGIVGLAKMGGDMSRRLTSPAGRTTEDAVEHLGGLLAADDIVIDGGDSFSKDDGDRARRPLDPPPEPRP